MSEESISTGAEAVTPAAESGSAEVTTETGADTQTVTAEGQGEVETENGQESTDGATEGETQADKDRGAHQKTLEERAAEIAEKKFQELEARLQERMKAQTPDFDPPEVEAMVQSNIVAATVRMRAIESEMEISSGDIDPALTQEYWQIKRWIAAAENALNENQKKRGEWEKKQKESSQQSAIIARVNAEIVEASPLVAQGLNISPEAWATGEKWFIEQRRANPLLDAEYRERCIRDGAFRGLKWAAEYVQREMGKKAEAAKQQKESGKDKAIGGDAETAQSFASVKNWADLMKLPSKDINRFAKEHPKRFADMKAKHFK